MHEVKDDPPRIDEGNIVNLDLSRTLITVAFRTDRAIVLEVVKTYQGIY